MAIQYDLVKANSSQATQYGVQITAGVIVSELPNVPGSTQLDTAITSVGWQVGSSHPIYPLYRCTDITANSIGTNEVEIIYQYEYKFPQVHYEVGSALVMGQTNLDKDGEVITVTHTYADDYKERSELAGEEVSTSVLVDKYVPETTLTIIRQEITTGLDLLDKSKTYTGKINSSPWLAVSDSFSRQWLCTGITGTSQDNGITYSVRYSFQRRENRFNRTDTGISYIHGWQKEVVFIDPRTDEPPADAEVVRYDIYDEIDFNNLGLE